nr:DUF1343 domain-containing protein [Dissulfurirhabdus thermomarina]
MADPPAWARGRRLGLLCHQASVDRRLRHARDLVAAALPGALRCLFSPQHGLYAEKQDNMVESPDRVDPVLGIPVFSLYGATREPLPEQLAHIDLLLVDLQDVGCRVYTYAWTLLLAMQAAARAGVAVAVLDRPNPVGGVHVEGNRLADDCRSFVGMSPIPMRHGLTLGELARYFAAGAAAGVELHVVPTAGWRRRMDFPATGLAWVWPSPNMPTLETARVYPGQVALEGTNLSEGRGTTRPFEVFGAPFVEPRRVAEALEGRLPPGVVLREQYFEPTFHKWRGETCGGFQLHVTDPEAFRPLRTTLVLLSVLWRLYPGEAAWREPPYEYETERLPIDLILGDRRLRAAVEAGADLRDFDALLSGDEADFTRERAARLLYPG